jgi:hypothetical protein
MTAGPQITQSRDVPTLVKTEKRAHKRELGPFSRARKKNSGAFEAETGAYNTHLERRHPRSFLHFRTPTWQGSRKIFPLSLYIVWRELISICMRN